MLQAERLGAAEGRETQRVRCFQRARVCRRRALQHDRCAQLGEGVEIERRRRARRFRDRPAHPPAGAPRAGRLRIRAARSSAGSARPRPRSRRAARSRRDRRAPRARSRSRARADRARRARRSDAGHTARPMHAANGRRAGPRRRTSASSSCCDSAMCVTTRRPADRARPTTSSKRAGATVYGACGETPSSTSGPAWSATDSSRASRRSAIATASSSLPPNTSSAITARRPSSLAAATDAPVNEASTTVVAPPRIASSTPSRASASASPSDCRRLALDVDVEPGPERQPVAEPSVARVLEVRVEVDEVRARARSPPGRSTVAFGCAAITAAAGPTSTIAPSATAHGTVSDGIRVDRDDPVGAQHERPAHEAPATGSFSAARPRRTSISRATQIDASYSTSSGRNSSSIETGSTPGSSAAIAASTTIA